MKVLIFAMGVALLSLAGCATPQQRAQWDAECAADPDLVSLWCTPNAYGDVWEWDDYKDDDSGYAYGDNGWLWR